MAGYYIRFSVLHSQVAAFHKVSAALGGLENKLGNIAASIDCRDGSMSAIKNRLLAAKRGFPALRGRIAAAGDAARIISAEYESAERNAIVSFENVNV